ncbi:MAG: hypothetical protein ACTSRK_18790 [Promethearchaeota archaeon]
MPVVKIKNKDEIDKLQATLSLRLNRKISQQETLDLCIKWGNQNIEQLLQLATFQSILTPENAEVIIHDFKQFKGTYYNVNAKFASDIDRDTYS